MTCVFSKFKKTTSDVTPTPRLSKILRIPKHGTKEITNFKRVGLV